MAISQDKVMTLVDLALEAQDLAKALISQLDLALASDASPAEFIELFHTIKPFAQLSPEKQAYLLTERNYYQRHARENARKARQARARRLRTKEFI